MDVKGRWALVTGGSRGIGAATVRELAKAGAKVAFTWHTGEREAAELARSLPEGAEPLVLACDVRRPGDIERVAAEVRARGIEIDVLVNNAGTSIPGTFLEATAEQWDDAFALHVRAPALFAKAFAPGMKERGRGVIVNIGSVAGIRGVANITLYCTVKGAVIQMTRAMARDLADAGVRAVCVSPGIIRTNFHRNMSAGQKKLNEDQRIPLHREGRPEEVARIIAALVEADYLTGENVVIDGGLTMRIA
jgi:NAD(P)-dependent dehydrogenase (short-subunit alcohol dehydrogenase family)